jgi:hypothetical protein
MREFDIGIAAAADTRGGVGFAACRADFKGLGVSPGVFLGGAAVGWGFVYVVASAGERGLILRSIGRMMIGGGASGESEGGFFVVVGGGASGDTDGGFVMRSLSGSEGAFVMRSWSAGAGE